MELGVTLRILLDFQRYAEAVPTHCSQFVDRWMELQEATAICMEVMQIGHLVSAQFSADWSDAPGIICGPPKIP